MRKELIWQGNSISYYVYGAGSRVAFGLHGYSLSGQVYEGLGNALRGSYTFYALDLPLHGHTQWQADTLSPAQLREVFHAIYWEEKKQDLDKYAVLAHSMGGRVALQYFYCFSDEIVQLILFAPDGLKLNKWYVFGVNHRLGRRLFHFLCRSSASFMAVARFFKKVGWINSSMFRLIASSMGRKSDAMLVYRRAIMFRLFLPDSREIGKIICQKQVETHLFFGKYDKIILPKVAKDILKYSQQSIPVHTLDCGHMILAAASEWTAMAAVIAG